MQTLTTYNVFMFLFQKVWKDDEIIEYKLIHDYKNVFHTHIFLLVFLSAVFEILLLTAIHKNLNLNTKIRYIFIDMFGGDA